MVEINEIALGADVHCDGVRCGQSSALIMNPIHDTLTHIVVKESHFPHAEHIVPIEDVLATTEEVIQLRVSAEEMEAMDPFVTAHYIRVDIPRYEAVGPLYSSPWIIPDPETDWLPVEEEQIPPHELAIRRGARVEATDGRVGKVDEFLVDPTSDHITHLVLREGHLWGKRDILIPVSGVKKFGEETVHLKLSKAEVEALPEIRVHRGILG